jgi:SET domain-containing protein
MIERRKSKIQGWGVFATETIPKNKRIIHYAGEKISNQESLKREARYLEKGHIWCFKLTNRTVIDAAVGGNIARYINHSCKPNCYIEIKDGTIWVRAAKTIRKGTELNYNYNTDGEGAIPCRCRPGCKNML